MVSTKKQQQGAVVLILIRRRIQRRSMVALLYLTLSSGTIGASSWISPPPASRSTRRTFRIAAAARRNKPPRELDHDDDLNRWYDSVEEGATPDDVYWEEMQRQNAVAAAAAAEERGAAEREEAFFASLSSSMSPQQQLYNLDTINQNYMPPSPSPSSSTALPSAKSVEATLSEYEMFAVDDNWLDDDLVEFMAQHERTFDDDEDDFYKGAPPLEDQLDEWEKEGAADHRLDDDVWDAPSDEPWDHWGEPRISEDDEDGPDGRIQFDENDPRRKPSEFLFDADEVTDDDDDDDEKRFAKLRVHSQRLERARNNPKAAAFFQREPDKTEGFDRMWVSAVDNACVKNLVGTFRNYGIQFADNFGDWHDGCIEDALVNIEDIASYKARQVYNVTGLPCIAARTSFEIEPVPDLTDPSSKSTSTAPRTAASIISSNPRVVSGYRFNDIGLHVDYICETLRPLSEPDRVTRFKTCLCYYDGAMEILDYGTCDVDLVFANSLRTFIPVAQAINEMMKTLELTFGLEYQKWLRTRMEEVLSTSGKASMKLRDRVLKEGRVLPNDIVDVSAFMDAMVDVNLMDECASELSNRFVNEKPSKILTVATTGLVLALPMAKYLQVPVVYARKERNIVMADTYVAGYSSKTVGKNRELLVSKSHLDQNDRVLIVDDFLSSGSSQEALLRIISQADATAVGVGVLLEKVYDSGRQSLSGFDIPIHSLCRIASVQNGVIQLLEEEGFDESMMNPQQTKR